MLPCAVVASRSTPFPQRSGCWCALSSSSAPKSWVQTSSALQGLVRSRWSGEVRDNGSILWWWVCLQWWALVCVIAGITCVRAMLPGWTSSCLPAGQRKCHFDTSSRSWGRLLFPKASSPAQSYLRRIKTSKYEGKTTKINTVLQCCFVAL